MIEGIGWAVSEMHRGCCVRRAGWNGKGMWIRIVQGSTDLRPTREIDMEHLGRLQWFVVMKTVDGSTVPWLCSQTDLLAQDWEHAGPSDGCPALCGGVP